MNGVVLAVSSSFFLGLSQVVLKKSYREYPPSISFLFDSIFGLFIWVPLAIILGANPSHFPITFIYAVISAILSEALYFYALSKGQLAVSGTILSSYSIYTIIFSYIINGEKLTQIQLFFIILTIIGTILSSIPSKINLSEIKNHFIQITWPLIGAIAVGLSDTLSKQIINRTSSFSFVFSLAIVQLPVALFYLKLEKQRIFLLVDDIKRKASDYKYPIIGSLFNIIGTGFLWLAFNYTLAAIASPITATSGAIVIFLALVVLKEKITTVNLFGVVISFLGVMGISFVAT